MDPPSLAEDFAKKNFPKRSVQRKPPVSPAPLGSIKILLQIWSGVECCYHICRKGMGDKLINTNSRGLYAHYKDSLFTGGGCQIFFFNLHPDPWKMIQNWRAYFSNGWVQPPTRYGCFFFEMNTFVNSLVQAVFSHCEWLFGAYDCMLRTSLAWYTFFMSSFLLCVFLGRWCCDWIWLDVRHLNVPWNLH